MQEVDKPNLIVSLTSFPARINFVHQTITTLLNQSKKPDRLILWLADSQFPKKEKNLPDNLLNLCKDGLEIEWCEDLKSYKKLIPALKKFPDDVIVTFDDDALYDKNCLKTLYESYLKNPKFIHCLRAHQITTANNCIKPYRQWNMCINNIDPSYNIFFTGVGGVLYPPKSLHRDVFKESLFLNLAPLSDDIWFWAMALKNNYKINVISNIISPICNIENSQNESLWQYNVANGGNDKTIKNILNYYPELLDKIDFTIKKDGYEKLESIINQNSNKKIAFWGASLFLKEFLQDNNDIKSNIVAIIDNNKEMQNKNILNLKIYAPEKIEDLDIDLIVITIKNNHNKIYTEIKKETNLKFPNIEISEPIFDKQLVKTAERIIPELYSSSIEDKILFLKHRFAYEILNKYISKGQKILEIGCGEGYGTNMLADNDIKIIAVDVNKKCITNAQKKYSRKNLQFIHYDGITLNHEDRSFDLIVSFQVIEHVEDVKNYLQNIKRLLKKNGKFIITTPNRVYRLAKGQRPWNHFHLREYDAEMLKKEAQNVFNEFDIYSITAKKEILNIEYERVRHLRADYKKEEKKDIIKSFDNNLSSDNFYLTKDSLYEGLDLVLTNIKIS